MNAREVTPVITGATAYLCWMVSNNGENALLMWMAIYLAFIACIGVAFAIILKDQP
jgi:hypothetical protein